MDNLFNDDNNIRPPDEIITEKLIEDNRSDFEKQIDQVLLISLLEIKEKENINKLHEEQVINDFINETNRRKNIFKEILFNLNKLSKYDKEVREIYEIIDEIIDAYCNQIIQKCELDIETYNKIFNTLKNIRNNELPLQILKTIILTDNKLC